MTATLNGKNVISCTLAEPRAGVWTSVVDVDSDQAITGRVTLVLDGVTWVGTVAKGDHHAGRVHAQIVGGAAKLAKELDVKHYRGVSLGAVVTDIMRETGETLSSDTDPAVRGRQVARWTRPRGKASLTLKKIADELGLVWRVQRDGTVWIGADKWVDSKSAHDEIDRTPGRDAVVIAPEAPHVAPGQSFGGRRVSRVTTSTENGSGLRQEILFESEAGGARVAEDIAAIVDQRTADKIDYSRLYPSKVLKQSADGSLEILPDAKQLRGNGLTGVPIRHGIPGLHVTVPPGGKVLLFFESGDPKLPAAALWPDGSSCTEVRLRSKLIVEGDIECTGEITAHSALPATRVTLGGHIHPSATGPTSRATPGQ